jgi:hypothetical protein
MPRDWSDLPAAAVGTPAASHWSGDVASGRDRRRNIAIGNRVSVAGDIDENFFGGPELEADSVIVLEHARDRDAGAS